MLNCQITSIQELCYCISKNISEANAGMIVIEDPRLRANSVSISCCVVMKN